MAETSQKRKIYSLSFVAKSIQKTIAKRYTQAYWIKAELNKLNYYQHSGHCYPELVEKKEGRVLTQIRSTLWKNDYQRINKSFLKLLKEPLKDGIKVLIFATIEFHPEYGLSLHILDIDPSFTLGDLEKEKQKSIEKLKKEGIFNQNKKIKFPVLPQRIAVISVQTSKGYADFLNVLGNAKKNNNYAFFQMLFPSLLQGDQAVFSLRKQLNRIRKVAHHFDIVVIVRGGGGEIGLTCYNNYELAKDIALFPIPVLTGIGHATNLTVAEMVAYKNAITPTGLAEELIRKFDEFAFPVEEYKKQVLALTKSEIKNHQLILKTEVKQFKTYTNNLISKEKQVLNQYGKNLFQVFRYNFKEQYHRLENLKTWINRGVDDFQEDKQRKINILIEKIRLKTQLRLQQNEVELKYQVNNLSKIPLNQLKTQELALKSLQRNVEILDPKNVLKRGYSISLLNGKSITKADQVKSGDHLEIELYQGKISAKVESVKEKQEK